MARRRKHRRNSSTPQWLPWAIVASGVVTLFFWKKANPGASLNPAPPPPPPV